MAKKRRRYAEQERVRILSDAERDGQRDLHASEAESTPGRTPRSRAISPA